MPIFEPAVRSKAKLRLALIGPSGSGKTYSGLAVASGLVGPEGKIAMIDTEHGSGSLYATKWTYDVATLEPPFTPRRYISLIEAGVKAGYDLLIIDSLSHAWAGEGGLLEMHEQRAAAVKNSFTAWRDVTPEHNKLVDAILRAPIHVIGCFRTKQAYEVIDDGSKKRVVKLGLAPLFREGIEYEFTTVLELATEKHVATASKDRTGLFDGQALVLTPEHGVMLRDWLNSGVDVPAKPVDSEAAQQAPAPEADVPAETPEPALAQHQQSTDAEEKKPAAMTVREMVYSLIRARGIDAEGFEAYVRARFGVASEDLRMGQWVLVKREIEGVRNQEQLDELTRAWLQKRAAKEA